MLRLPECMSFEQGAAMPVNYGTAYAALVLMAIVRPGETCSCMQPPEASGSTALQILRDRGSGR